MLSVEEFSENVLHVQSALVTTAFDIPTYSTNGENLVATVTDLKNTGEDSKHLKLYYSIRAYYVTNGAKLKKKSSAKFKHGNLILKKIKCPYEEEKKNIKFTTRLHS
jgi:hypothetical protein